MSWVEWIFWISLILLVYIWIGYPLFLFLVNRLRRRNPEAQPSAVPYEPEVTLLVAAYNEKTFVPGKVENSLDLDYPAGKLHLVWVTDGSDDGTEQDLKRYPGVVVYHQPERQGKIAAINRVMPFITSEIVVFSDANTLVGRESIREMVRLFSDPLVGCVSGEKRIVRQRAEQASGAGEGLYWKYEGLLKSQEAAFGSVIGAPGELFAIRRNLFEAPEPDTILDDFVISLRIAARGFRIAYHQSIYSTENPSQSVKEEMKRKTRISAGDFQAFARLLPLLNPFRYGWLSFQYISHKVMRWTVGPLALVGIWPLNLLILVREGLVFPYPETFFLLSSFFLLAFLGFIFEKKNLTRHWLFLPYYFLSANLSFFSGWWRSLRGSQPVAWEKARRREMD